MKNVRSYLATFCFLISLSQVNAQTTPIDNITAGPHLFAEMQNVHVVANPSDVDIVFDLYLSASQAYVDFVQPVGEGGQGVNFGMESMDLAFDIELGSYVNSNTGNYVYGAVSAYQSGLQIARIQGLNNVKGASPAGMDSKFKLSLFRDLNSLPLTTTPTKVGNVSVKLPVTFASGPDASTKLALRLSENGFGTGLSGSKWNDFSGHTRNLVGSAAPSQALPVTLLSFDARQENATVTLLWKTAEETNSDHFDVQRSKDGHSWITVQSVKALGESSKEHEYNTVDAAPMDGINLYRLRMVDADQSEAFSKIIHVQFLYESSFVYPNPAFDRLYFKNQHAETSCSVELINAGGLPVLKSATMPKDGIDIKVLKPGVYNLKVLEGSTERQFRVVIIH